MTVQRHRGARLEPDQVQHRALSEQRAARDPCDELEGANLVEADELRLHAGSIIVASVTAVEVPLLRRQAYVDGEWVDADSGETFPVVDPATGEVVAEVPRMGAAETRRAIAAAERALPAWRRAPRRTARAILRRLADLMLEREDDLPRCWCSSRASRSPRRASRSSTRRPSTSGSARRRSASTATRSRRPWPDRRIHRDARSRSA